MKPGRPPKGAAEYANSRAVEAAMLRLFHTGKVWVRSREIVQEMQRGGVPNARVVWNRGKTRLINDHGRLEVKAELDSRHKAIEKYALRFVEGRTFSISIREYAMLPEDLRRYFVPFEPASVKLSKDTVFEGLGKLFDALSTASLRSISTEKIEEEVLRRERQDPDELLSPFARASGEESELLMTYRPVGDRILRQLTRARAVHRAKAIRIKRAAKPSPGPGVA